MTENGNGLSVRQAPRKRAPAAIKDFTMMVRVPGDPAAVRVFTDVERADADTYAADTGGTLVPLPLRPSAEPPHSGSSESP